jgi:hypothetical protein
MSTSPFNSAVFAIWFRILTGRKNPFKNVNLEALIFRSMVPARCINFFCSFAICASLSTMVMPDLFERTDGDVEADRGLLG